MEKLLEQNRLEEKSDDMVFPPSLKAEELGTFSTGNDLPADTW